MGGTVANLAAIHLDRPAFESGIEGQLCAQFAGFLLICRVFSSHRSKNMHDQAELSKLPLSINVRLNGLYSVCVCVCGR